MAGLLPFAAPVETGAAGALGLEATEPDGVGPGGVLELDATELDGVGAVDGAAVAGACG